MALQLYDIEIDDTELEDFGPTEFDSDTRIEILETDVVEVVAFEEDKNVNSVAPLRTFWDCPPLALAGLCCALIYCATVILFYGCLVALPLWLGGLL